jgi:hypothetical protein
LDNGLLRQDSTSLTWWIKLSILGFVFHTERWEHRRMPHGAMAPKHILSAAVQTSNSVLEQLIKERVI